MSNVTLNNDEIFESIKHLNKNNYEYWEARELRIALGYYELRNFINVLNKAIIECRSKNKTVEKHFIKYMKRLECNQRIVDYKLSKYACYLICKNGFYKKETVLQGRIYFSNKIKSRK